MMKKFIIYLLPALILFSCKKEGSLLPSNVDKNFFEIIDNPSDSVDHAIFQFYQSTKIPVFYKDTIGIDARVDPFGISYNFYKKLGVDYNPDFQTLKFGLVTKYLNLKKKADVIPALKFLSTYIVPALPKGVLPQSFFVPDTLNNAIYGTRAYKGFNTVVIGAVPRISKLGANEINLHRAAILRAIASAYVLDAKNTAFLNSNFYSVSRAFLTTPDIYGLSIYNIASLKGISSAVYNNYTASYLQTLGFLGKDPSISDFGFPSIYNIQSPPTYLDVNQFIEASFTYSTAQFTAMYGSNVAIMKKYNAIKSLLTGLGFVIN
ncbi:hypothetical protein [Pedobacter frigidisoli]|uniref:hypothetical protein n=1 Tax=Pedobacter frigidisoli TaxID=2530455 RepID=UPI002930FEA3|nr:hypothetical protein [Pedobacter frigidisoli]